MLDEFMDIINSAITKKERLVRVEVSKHVFARIMCKKIEATDIAFGGHQVMTATGDAISVTVVSNVEDNYINCVHEYPPADPDWD